MVRHCLVEKQRFTGREDMEEESTMYCRGSIVPLTKIRVIHCRIQKNAFKVRLDATENPKTSVNN